MYDLLLEVLCEEIPASMQKPGAETLKSAITNGIVDQGLNYQVAVAYWTPRRLCLDIRGISAKALDKIVEYKGPSVNAPQQAIDGFLRKVGLNDISEAEIVSNPKKGDYYLARISQKGQSAAEILSSVIPKALSELKWAKSMCWGTHNPELVKFVRPIKNILCVICDEYSSEVIDFQLFNIRSNNVTYGHRFLSDGKPIEVKKFDDYLEKITKNYVILDPQRRQDLIKDAAANLAFAKGIEVLDDAALLMEVANLVEYPEVLIGEFPTKFLDIPSKAIQTTIRENQKCFVTRPLGETSKLSNYFIICSNMKTADNGAAIIKGNNKVVRARLQDAYYFFSKDQELIPEIEGIDLPLDQRLQLLFNQGAIFHEKLGTQEDRVNRLINLSEYISKQMSYPDIHKVNRAAKLAKADLASEMVGEFPNLQGYIGSKYAILQGEDPAVAAAIEDHYKPQGPNDTVPEKDLSIIVALADKIDLLVSFWKIGEKPSGSRDPFALRRAAIGIIRLLLVKEIPFDLEATLEYAARDLSVAQEVFDFINDRFKNYLRDNGARYDAIEAVTSTGNFYEQEAMVKSLTSFLDSDKGHDFTQAIKRVYNILATSEPVSTEFNPALENEPAAMGLYSKLRIDIDEPEDLSELTADIENFFLNVMVNDENPEVKLNRLQLLQLLKLKTLRIADFSKIVLS